MLHNLNGVAMLVDNVVPMLGSVPLGLVAVSGALANIEHLAIRGSAMDVNEKVHNQIILTPPLPWATPATN